MYNFIGMHELRLSADFYVNFNRINEQNFIVWSNTIQITVIEGENTND